MFCNNNQASRGTVKLTLIPCNLHFSVPEISFVSMRDTTIAEINNYLTSGEKIKKPSTEATS
jgi:hypothetical protein